MKDILNKIGDTKTCTAAIIIRGGKILMGHRHYTKENTNHEWKVISVWTTPGGRCDEGEKIEENLLREIEEETGIKNLNIKEFLGKVSGAKERDEVFVFSCETEDECILMEPQKFSEWKWFPLSEIPPDFINPNILKLLNNSRSKNS